MPRIGADLVTVVVDERADGGRLEAHVQGQRRSFYVDFIPAWAAGWLCTCGHAPDCAHIRAVKEAVA